MSKKLIIFDVDGCLYQHTPEWQQACLNAETKVGVDHLGLDPEEAAKLGLESFLRTGKVSQEWIARGLSRNIAHHAYHANMDIHAIKSDPHLREALLPLAQSDEVILATYSHGSRTWMYKALTKLGVQDLFEPELTTALEDAGFRYKHTDSQGFREIFERAGRYALSGVIPFNQAAMVEDTAQNLVIPAQLGMRTHLVDVKGKATDHSEPHIQARHASIHEALDHIKVWALG